MSILKPCSFNFLAYRYQRERWEEKETVRNKNRTVSVENTSPDKKKGRRENKRENWVLRYCWDKKHLQTIPRPVRNWLSKTQIQAGNGAG